MSDIYINRAVLKVDEIDDTQFYKAGLYTMKRISWCMHPSSKRLKKSKCVGKTAMKYESKRLNHSSDIYLRGKR